MNVSFSSQKINNKPSLKQNTNPVNNLKYREIQEMYTGALFDLINIADEENMSADEYYRRLNALQAARDEAICQLDVLV